VDIPNAVSKELRSLEYDAHSSAAMKSGVFCRRNCCVTFVQCDVVAQCGFAGIQSHCPDKVDNIQSVKKASTDQRNSSGQL